MSGIPGLAPLSMSMSMATSTSMSMAMAMAKAATGLLLLLLAGCADPLGGGRASGDGRVAAQVERGYSAVGARIVETNDEGEPRYTIEAQRIEQDPDSRRIRLVRPDLELETERGRWTATAASGELPEDAGVVSLAGDVLVRSRVGARLEPIEIRTDFLKYAPDTSIASGDSLVTISLSGQTLRADGFVANLKAQTLRLESDVNGRFVPNRK